jgi:photosystem II stability/assembly factor-like uncharacterized protein
MKNLLLLLIVIASFAINPLNAQIDDNWAEIGNAAYNSTLSSMVFISPETGYAVGSGGSFLKTENGGITWSVVEIGYRLNFKKINFLNSQKGFLIGNDGKTNQVSLLKTIDGGLSWTAQVFGVDEYNASELYFYDENIGFIAGNEWYYKTTDGGSTWVKKELSEVYTIYDIQFLNENKGFMVAVGGTFSTTDGGENWAEIITDISTCIQFTDALTGYIANGSNQAFQKTTDGGLTWNSIPKPPIDFVDQIFFTDNNIGFAFSTDDYDAGKVAKTTDGGASWTIIVNEPRHKIFSMIKHQNKLIACGRGGLIMESNNMEEFNVVQEGLLRGTLNDMVFLDANTAIAVGEAGTIVKTTDKCASWSRIESGVSKRLWGICKTPSGHLYVVGDHSTVIKSTDGGVSWTSCNNGFFTEANSFGEIQFIDDNTGYITKSQIYKTSDAGANWEIVSDEIFCNSISIPHPDTIYVSSRNVIVSTDHGATWSTLKEENHLMYGLHFVNGQTGIAANDSKNCFSTNDGGATWTQHNFWQDMLRDAHMFDNQTWYAIGVGGIIRKTSNAGETWDLVASGTGRTLCDIFFGPDGTGYILGEDGIILRKAIVDTYTLTFNITKQNGANVSDATITLNGFGYPAGHYVFEGLLPGDYTWKIQRSGYCDEEGSFELSADRTENIVLGTCFEVIVNVTDYQNNELEGASVTLGTETKISNNLGRAIFNVSAAGNYDISIQKTGFQTYTNTVNLSGGITLNYALLLEILPPEALFANNITNLSFTARWVKPENAEICLLYVSADDFATHLPGFNGLPVSVTQYTVDGLEADKTYKYRLIGKNGDAESGLSNIIEVRTALHGLFDDEAICIFSVQPNPAKDHITINLPEEMQNASYFICNSMGVIQQSAEIKAAEKQEQVNISRLPEGFYTILIFSNDRKFMSKFIKIQ